MLFSSDVKRTETCWSSEFSTIGCCRNFTYETLPNDPGQGPSNPDARPQFASIPPAIEPPRNEVRRRGAATCLLDPLYEGCSVVANCTTSALFRGDMLNCSILAAILFLMARAVIAHQIVDRCARGVASTDSRFSEMRNGG
jgi:hypothetical protein